MEIYCSGERKRKDGWRPKLRLIYERMESTNKRSCKAKKIMQKLPGSLLSRTFLLTRFGLHHIKAIIIGIQNITPVYHCVALSGGLMDRRA